jgi:SAM-dependent methyltransferase
MSESTPRSLPKSDYKEYPKTLAPDDFWGQVRRTVHGKPVPEEQIAMIVRSVRENLDLRAQDSVLDLACGNGALSRYLFAACHALLGVDYSEYLIGVAKANFERLPDYAFTCLDAAAYVESEPDATRFTKALCYGSFSYFPAPDAVRVLRGLRQRFTSLRTLYLGNLPDRALAAKFYTQAVPAESELDDHAAQIGIWRSETQLRELAEGTGWRVRFLRMPASFFGAHYRYDAVLEPGVAPTRDAHDPS